MTEEELKALLAEGAQTGVLEAGERDMIERLLRLADKPVRAIMTPRNEIAYIDRSDPRHNIEAALKAAPHSRFVVCDGSIDNVVGGGAGEGSVGADAGGWGAVDIGGVAAADGGAGHDFRVGRVGAVEGGYRGEMALVMDEYGSFEGGGDGGQCAGGDHWRCA